MNRYFRLFGVALMVLEFAFTVRATTATSLGSFEGIEEPLVRYAPATASFKPDDFVNITDLGGGAFRMFLRYRSDEWDGDRDTHNTDRQRAEVKGLGRHQKTGETFEYGTTWRSNPEFHGASRFCHIFQLKSTNGDSGAPVVTLSIDEGRQTASVRYWSGHAKDSTVAREFRWVAGEWQSVRIRVTTSAEEQKNGAVVVSVNGDAFQGAQNIPVFRTGATDYRPKWGLYRAAKPGLKMGDDFIEHKAISAVEAGASPTAAASVRPAHPTESPEKIFAELKTQTPSEQRAEALATAVAEWAKSDPAAAMTAAEKLAPEDDRVAAIQRVFNRWSDCDPAAVLKWAKHRGPSAELDDLLWYFATDTTFRYVLRPIALEGAQLIADPSLRMEAIEHVVLIWARGDPANALRYVQTVAGLTMEQKNAIVRKIDARRKS